VTGDTSATGRGHLDEPDAAGGGRRRLRESDAAGTGAWELQPAGDPAAETGGSRRRLGEPDAAETGAWRPESAAGPTVETTGRRHRAEPSTGSPAAALAEPRPGRRRAAEPAQGGGTRRTLGAEYLIDTGEQAVWTGGARRYAPQPEPPTEPIGLERNETPAEPNAEQPPAGTGDRPRGRHATGEDGESTTATVPLRALIGELDADRPSGRHRRPH
jgi:hypothetical protein